MTMKLRILIPALAAAALLPLAGAARAADDFPTVDRVLYVNQCMRDHPGSFYEMVNKCSCALDALSREVSFDDYTTMTTIVNAMTIGGERAAEIRDNETLKPELRRYRDLQEKVKKGCFIQTQPAR